MMAQESLKNRGNFLSFEEKDSVCELVGKMEGLKAEIE